jgi:HD-GYP domain-containing protein (c-di-GMP phosphodiesterase class II)
VARLLAAADAFDAMTTHRAYRQGRSTLEACDVLREGAGSQWDPDIARTLANLMAVTPVAPLVAELDVHLRAWREGAGEDVIPAS